MDNPTTVTEKEADARIGVVNDLMYAYMNSGMRTDKAQEYLKKINRVTEGRCAECGRPVASVHELSPWGSCNKCQP